MTTHARKHHLSATEAHDRAEALNPHLRRQGRELVVHRKADNIFLVMKRLPPTGSSEGATENVAPPVTKLEIQHGITPGPEPYTLADYFAFAAHGKENRKRVVDAPFKSGPVGERKRRKVR